MKFQYKVCLLCVWTLKYQMTPCPLGAPKIVCLLQTSSQLGKITFPERNQDDIIWECESKPEQWSLRH